MSNDLNIELLKRLDAAKTYGSKSPRFVERGLKASELDNIESQLGFQLPPDMRFLLENLDDSNNRYFSWKNFDLKAYEKSIEQIQEGIEFDIENNGLWLNRWGEHPLDMVDAKSIMREDFRCWPKLVPVFGHRYLAVEPYATNNPVFSVNQTDIICYGANLGAYLTNEFLKQSDDVKDWTPIKTIPIWHDFIVRPEGFLTEGFVRL